MCCCGNLHRHQIHLISYGVVSCGLIMTGLVFTVFAIFQKESQIGKVWLAGPTTMVVGLVLAGKVFIDWGPAMLHGREGSIDSRLFEQGNSQLAFDCSSNRQVKHEPNCTSFENGSRSLQLDSFPPRLSLAYDKSPRYTQNSMLIDLPPSTSQLPRSSIGCVPPRRSSPADKNCRIYSGYNSPLYKQHEHFHSSSRHINRTSCYSPRQSLFNTFSKDSNHSGHSGEHTMELTDACECAQYGTMRHLPPSTNDNPPYQGESFVLNERSYLI